MRRSLHPETVDLLSASQIDCMLRDVLRVPELFATAKLHLTPEHFDPAGEPAYHVLWRVVLALVEKRGTDAWLFGPPAQVRTYLEVEARSYVEGHPDDLLPMNHPQLFAEGRDEQGLIPWIFGSADSELNPVVTREYLGRFLSERGVQRPLRQAMSLVGTKSIANLPDLLQRHIELDAQYRGVGVNPIKSVAPAGWRPTAIQKMKTGIDFIDEMLDGGHAPHEVYGMLGAYGSGKTMYSVQLVCSAVNVQLGLAASVPGYKPKHTYLFHYEAGEEEIRIRMWSYIAQISWQRLLSFNPDTLSTCTDMTTVQPYEKEYFAKALTDGGFLGERERLEQIHGYSEYVHLVDMSGPVDCPLQGTGYVQEIAQIMSTWAKDVEVGAIVIDYAGVAARRHMNRHGLKPEMLRHLIGGFGDECRRQLATPFNCPVWVMHQLAAASNKRSAVVRHHHADAAEAKNFAENMTFCLEMGVPDEKSRCYRMNCSKARRAALPPPQTVRIDGPMSRLIDASSEYFFDEMKGGFLPVSEAAIMAAKQAEELRNGGKPVVASPLPNVAVPHGLAAVAGVVTPAKPDDDGEELPPGPEVDSAGRLVVSYEDQDGVLNTAKTKKVKKPKQVENTEKDTGRKPKYDSETDK